MNEEMDFNYGWHLENTLEQAIQLQFPTIQDLTVNAVSGFLHVSFTSGATQDEIETFIKTLKRDSYLLSHPITK